MESSFATMGTVIWNISGGGKCFPRWLVAVFRQLDWEDTMTRRILGLGGACLAVGGVFLFVCGMSRPATAQLIVAHRGASSEAPENTLSSFKLAWQRGADAIEGDFYLTRDGRIVTIHDKTTGRTADRDLPVANSTLAQLRQLDFGSWKSPKYAGERIPLLTEVLATIPPGKQIFIEIKCGPEIVPKLKKVLAESHLAPEQTNVIAFDRNVIAAVKKQIPQIKAYWLVGYRRNKKTGKWSPTVAEVLDTLKAIGADGLDTQDNRAVVNKAMVQKLRAAGMSLHVWTVDDPKIARYYQKLGFDSITTNHPRLIRKSLESGRVQR